MMNMLLHATFIQESSKLVGHVPIELSFLVFTFLRVHEDNQVVVEVTGSRKLVLTWIFLSRK